MRFARLTLVIGIVATLLASLIADVRAASTTLHAPRDPEAPGTFPDDWIDGTDCENEPPFQVHAYNDDFYILRQSKCVHFEAPFLYLIFGDEKALLLDTGAHGKTPVYDTVMGVVRDWMKANDKDVPLIVAHTHTHADHFMGDEQFRDAEGVERVVGVRIPDMIEFWGFEDYPSDAVTIDLGGRVLDVLGIPGHNATSIAVYDRRTQLLLTGDTVYPGHIFIFSPEDWRIFIDSMKRLAAFCRDHPVAWVLGCHIEFTTTPKQPYGYSTREQPDETHLQLEPSIIQRILDAALEMEDDPQCTIYDDFVIHIVYECGLMWNGDDE